MTTQPSKGLHIALWVAQILLLVAFGLGGLMKLAAPIDQLAKNMAWVSRMPAGLVRFIGLAELSGALGMLLPAATRIQPGLTPLAAVGLMLIMLLAAGHHSMNGEANVVPINLFLGGLAAFVAWGRFRKAPIAPR